MSHEVPISRKSFIVSAIAFCSVAIAPKTSGAETLDFQFSTPEEYIDAINASGIGWTTYGLTSDDTMTVIDEQPTLSISSIAQTTRGKGNLVKIGIKVGKELLGYVFSEVIDGIIVKVTGKSGGYWVSYAAKQLLGHRVPPNRTYRLPCSIYPQNSGEYVRCTRG